jgi:SAM-dependent methyltransferase
VFSSVAVDPNELYAEGYFQQEEYADYAAQRDSLTRNLKARARDLRRYSTGGRLLELGCAYGYFLGIASEWWCARGIDISEHAVRHAREALGVDAVQGDFLQMEDEPEAYDVVCLWDTIEHLRRPVAVLEKAARSLRPGGVLALTTGDVESRLARWRGERWRLIHPPTHLFYFSRRTIAAALRRCGLEVVDISYVGYYRSLGAILHGLFVVRRNPGSILRRLAASKLAQRVPIYLNTFDIMQVIARKPRV